MEKLVRIDFDNIGDKIDFYLFKNDFINAQEISNIIKNAINDSISYINTNFINTRVLLIGADDILFSCEDPTKKSLEELKMFYNEKTNLTVSIGVGKNIKEVILNLKEAKVSGKNIIIGI